MPNRVTFAFIREGTSDDGLLPHLRTLIVRAGAEEAVGSGRDYKGTTEQRLRSLLNEESSVNLVFVHRDSDSRRFVHRYDEVSNAASAVGIEECVAIVPVQELEAWLLVDESAIRNAVGRPQGRRRLDIPALGQVENTGGPKEVLKAACLAAREATGRRHDKERKKFGLRRRVLLERLDVDGPIRQLPAWQRFERDLAEAVDRIIRSTAVTL
jgi:hypothetical protein